MLLLAYQFYIRFYRLDSHDKFGKVMSGSGEYPEPALAVGKINENFDPMIPPATGEEYIQRVV
jgi:hypothetical protein